MLPIADRDPEMMEPGSGYDPQLSMGAGAPNPAPTIDWVLDKASVAVRRWALLLLLL